MSTYVTVQGEITYETDETFSDAVRLLTEQQFVDNRGFFVGEDGDRVCKRKSVRQAVRQIEIPFFHYRNLGRLLDQLFVGGKGWLTWTSTDGMFSGGVYQDGKETTFSLGEWAKEHFFDEGEFMPNAETDFDEYVEIAAQIESAFHEEHGQ